MRPIHLVAGFCLLLLAGCGAPSKAVFPPAVALEQLEAPAAGEWQATLRLLNQSYEARVRFDLLTLELRLDGEAAGRIVAEPRMEVAARTSDTLRVNFDPPASLREAIAGRAPARLQYTFAGTATLSDEGRSPREYPVEGDGWLAPVPGLPHSYR